MGNGGFPVLVRGDSHGPARGASNENPAVNLITAGSDYLNLKLWKAVLLPLSNFADQLQPLVAPQVSHFSQVPFRTIVKFWHSEHMLPV
jgi:hypothetical protein